LQMISSPSSALLNYESTLELAMDFDLGLKIMLAIYVVVSLAMIGLILLQRGQGAQAGSGFGGGASATVFGSRGSANFLSISTKWLAVTFFGLSIGMGVYISRNGKAPATAASDIGIMADAANDATTGATQSADASEVPVVPASDNEVPSPAAPATSVTPGNPEGEQPAESSTDPKASN
jgi:preprotein translocase subunit SecG